MWHGVLPTSGDSSPLLRLMLLFGVFYVALAFAERCWSTRSDCYLDRKKACPISSSALVLWSRRRYCKGARASVLFNLVAVAAESSSWFKP
jgi:hypothetical protein